MAHQVVWEKVNAGFAPGETDETIVHRGAFLPDFVDDYTRSALVSAGAVKYVPEDAPDPVLMRESIVPPPVRLPEHPADLPRTSAAGADLIRVAGLEDDARQLVEEYDAASRGGPQGERGLPDGVGDETERPPHGNASLETWADYHVRRRQADGASEEDARAEVEGLSRDDIRALYKQ